ncbi:MAG TPA: mitochondrial fission ELM1 family protein [Hyphomonadaceae bacterium]|nr:mitochondrial fission ELM1 family protein [Hyphomonadaceae bacterium]
MPLGGHAGPAIWTVADGRAGILNQVKALRAALEEPERAARLAHIRSGAHRAAPLILQPHGFQVNLKPNLWPAPFAALPEDQRELLTPPWPDLWIAAGRRSIPYSSRMRRITRGKTMVVQTQDPKVPLGPFDLVIPPEHDGLAGKKVFPILGAPTWFAADKVSEAQNRFASLKAEAGQKILVSLGGDSRTHTFSEDTAGAIETVLEGLAPGRRLWITVSRRTPQHARMRFRATAQRIGAVFWENEQRDGPNPYLAFLSMCDVALVTEDSANMISDPAFFAKPIYMLKLAGHSKRFDRMHKGFIDRGVARWFGSRLETWNYPPLREAARAADEIVRLMLERHPR